MWYLVNSPKARTARKKGRRKMARRQTAAQRRASLRNLAKARRARSHRGRASNPKRRRRRNPPPRGKRTVAWRKRAPAKRRYSYGKKQRRAIRTNPSHRRYRRRRHNPGFVTQLTSGFRDTALVLGGKAASRIVANFIPLPQDGIMGTGVQLLTTFAVSWGARKFLGANAGHMAFVGGLMGVVEPYAKMIPVIGPALGDEMEMGEYLSGVELPMGELPMGEDEVGAYEVGEMYN